MHLFEMPVKLQKAIMLRSLIAEYYSFEAAGGSCHIILDDHNYSDADVDFCIGYSIGNNDVMGETIAKLLLEFTEEERRAINSHEFNLEFIVV